MRNKIDNVNRSGGASDDLLEAIHAVMHLARSRQHQALRERGQNLTPLEVRVLAYFARHPGATQRDLAEFSSRDKGQLARLVSGLRERGLLEAQADPQDRRIARLQLTGKAQVQQEALRRQRRQLADAATAGLSDEQRRQLLAGLQQVRSNLEALLQHGRSEDADDE